MDRNRFPGKQKSSTGYVVPSPGDALLPNTSLPFMSADTPDPA